MEKQVKDLINEINEETRKQWKDITDKVNANESLPFFAKWCTAQESMDIRYRCVREIQKELRDNGWDIKIDMQTYELSFYGKIEKDVA